MCMVVCVGWCCVVCVVDVMLVECVWVVYGGVDGLGGWWLC